MMTCDQGPLGPRRFFSPRIPKPARATLVPALDSMKTSVRPALGTFLTS